MGRKLALGCLVVFVLLFVAGGGVLWWFVLRPAGSAFGAVQDLGRIESIREGIADRSPYDPPADGELSEDQVDRYLDVQSAMREELEGRLQTLRERYESLEARQADPTPAQIAQAWSDVAGTLVDATRAQVEALNRHGFSLEEYRWVRSRVLEAAGFAVPVYDLPQVATGGEAPEAAEPELAQRAVPDRNAELVEPHRDTIEETLPFAWFGL